MHKNTRVRTKIGGKLIQKPNRGFVSNIKVGVASLAKIMRVLIGYRSTFVHIVCHWEKILTHCYMAKKSQPKKCPTGCSESQQSEHLSSSGSDVKCLSSVDVFK